MRATSPSRSQAVAPAVPRPFGVLLGQLMSLIHRRSAGDTLAILNDAGLTMPQLVSLYVLSDMGSASVGTIADCLRLSPAATSHLVDRLVKAGFVGRTEDPNDRRQKRLVITATGAALVRRVYDARTRECASAFSRVSPGVRKSFATALVAVIDELESRPGRRP